jgi:hypothetical protein
LRPPAPGHFLQVRAQVFLFAGKDLSAVAPSARA